MLYLFTFLSLISLLALCVGIIYPKAIRQTSRSRAFKIYGTATLLLFAITGSFVPKQETKIATVKNETVADSPSETLKIKIAQESDSVRKPLAIKNEVADLPPEKVNYQIAKEDKMGKIWRGVDVILPERIDEQMLTRIGKEIRENCPIDYEKTFICYKIAGEAMPSAWATTHFNPGLEVEIHGSSKAEHEKLLINNPKIPGEIFGSWLSHDGFEAKMIAYKKSGKVFIRSIATDGSSIDEIYQLTTHKGLKRLQDKSGKESGGYYLINAKGELEYWSKNGNFYTAKPI